MQLQPSERTVSSSADIRSAELQFVLLSKPAFEIATPLDFFIADEVIHVGRTPFLLPPMEFGIVVIGKLFDTLGEPLGIEIINHGITVGRNSERVSAEDGWDTGASFCIFAAKGQEGIKLLVRFVGNPIPFVIRFELFPLYAFDAALLIQKIIFLLLAPILANRMVINRTATALGVVRIATPDKEIDAYANLNSKNIVGGAGKFGVLPHVAAEVEDVNLIEILRQFLAHPVKRLLRDKTVIVHETNDSTADDSVRCVTNSLHIRISQLAQQCGIRGFAVSGTDAPFQFGILAVFVVVVFIRLPCVVDRKSVVE